MKMFLSCFNTSRNLMFKHCLFTFDNDDMGVLETSCHFIAS